MTMFVCKNYNRGGACWGGGAARTPVDGSHLERTRRSAFAGFGFGFGFVIERAQESEDFGVHDRGLGLVRALVRVS